MPVPQLDSLEMMFHSRGQWRTSKIDVISSNVSTLRYCHLAFSPFFLKEQDAWRPIPQPYITFGLPRGAAPENEQSFMHDYLGLVAGLANELGVQPEQAPACLPQIVFELFDEQRFMRDAGPPLKLGDQTIPVVGLIQPRHFKKQPADISFFYQDQWRILEIDGPSHSSDEGMKETKRRNELYGTVNARVATVYPRYDSQRTPIAELLALLDIDLEASMMAVHPHV